MGTQLELIMEVCLFLTQNIAMAHQITAQIGFYPIQSSDYKSEVNQAIELIRQYPLEFEIGLLSTTVRGNREVVFQMLQALFTTMETRCRFTMSVTMSNLCGCDG